MNKRRVLINILLYSVFVLYIILLLYVVLISRVHWRSNFRSVNLIPFYFVKNYIANGDLLTHSVAFQNVFGNIVLFVPMGVYIPLIRQKRKILINMLIIFLITLAVEIIQYILGVGVTDVDDVILNCAGGLIGIVAYNTLFQIAKDPDKARLVVAVFAPVAGLCLFVIFAIF